MKTLISTIFLIAMAGCDGLMAMPLVERLDDQQQKKVDQSWENMFETVDRLDRELLLDCIIAARLHQYGVDSLRLVSEKYVGENLVVMEVRYDREEPAFDEFTVTYIDKSGNELRRERYSREDVEENRDFLFTSHSISEDMDEETRLEIECMNEERDARFEEIREILAPLTNDSESEEDNTLEASEDIDNRENPSGDD